MDTIKIDENSVIYSEGDLALIWNGEFIVFVFKTQLYDFEYNVECTNSLFVDLSKPGEMCIERGSRALCNVDVVNQNGCYYFPDKLRI